MELENPARFFRGSMGVRYDFGLSLVPDVLRQAAIGSAPRPALESELCPIADNAIGIGAGVNRLNVWRLCVGSFHGHPHDNCCCKPASWKSRHRHRSASRHVKAPLSSAPSGPPPQPRRNGVGRQRRRGSGRDHMRRPLHFRPRACRCVAVSFRVGPRSSLPATSSEAALPLSSGVWASSQ
jgi:hypothetical protein